MHNICLLINLTQYLKVESVEDLIFKLIQLRFDKIESENHVSKLFNFSFFECTELHGGFEEIEFGLNGIIGIKTV